MLKNFLKTQLAKDELKIALKVIKEYKSNEDLEEWLMHPFDYWVELENLERCLEYLINKKYE